MKSQAHSDVEEEDVSKYEDNLDVNSECSDSESEFEDGLHLEYEPPAQEPVTGRASQRYLSMNGLIERSSSPVRPGPTRFAVGHVQDIKSSFELLIPDSVQNIILDMTNLEWRRVFGDQWRRNRHHASACLLWHLHPCRCLQVKRGVD